MDPSIIDRVIDLAVQIQQIPAPTCNEEQRARFVHGFFSEIGMNEVWMDDTGNVYSCIRGMKKKPAIVVSAHLDTVFQTGTNLSIIRTSEKISGPGIGDNSIGLAGLCGLYWAITGVNHQRDCSPDLDGDLWLVANVGEEGLGDLRGMKTAVDRIGNEVMAFIILEGLSFGQIYHRGLGVKRYRISVDTKGGHSWVDYGNASAIHELADLLVKIKNLPLPVEPRTSLNVGMITGGTSVNTIAANASMEVDLRSVEPQVLQVISNQVLSLVEEANCKGGKNISVIAEVIGDRPAGQISTNHPLVKLAVECYAKKGITVKLNIGSTDANVPLSRGLPAICVGLTTGGGAHTIGEYMDLRSLPQGLEIIENIIRSIFERGIKTQSER